MLRGCGVGGGTGPAGPAPSALRLVGRVLQPNPAPEGGGLGRCGFCLCALNLQCSASTGTGCFRYPSLSGTHFNNGRFSSAFVGGACFETAAEVPLQKKGCLTANLPEGY